MNNYAIVLVFMFSISFCQDKQDTKQNTKQNTVQKKGGKKDTSLDMPPLPGPGEPKAKGKAKVVSFFELPSKIESYALDADLLIPEWSKKGNKPKEIQDDDLLTHWSCKFVKKGEPCAIGMAFENNIDISALRIFSNSGRSNKENTNLAAIKTATVYTDSGWFKVELENKSDYQYIVFNPAVSTQSLSIEINDIYPADKNTDIQIAELDAIGKAGKKRPPLKIDTNRVIAKGDGPLWIGENSENIEAADTWLETIDGNGKSKRLFLGTLLHGDNDRRFLLVEKFESANCTGAYRFISSYYTLIDKENRIFYRLIFKTEGRGSIHVRKKGEGFAIGSLDIAKDISGIFAVLIDNLEVIHTKSEDQSYDNNAVEKFGFHSSSVRTIPAIYYDSCSPPKSKGLLDVVVEFLKLKKIDWYVDDWQVCKLDSGYKVYMYSPGCSNNEIFAIAVSPSDGKFSDDPKKSSGEGQIRMMENGKILISIERDSGNAGDIFTIDKQGKLKNIYPNAQFNPGEPATCRRCPVHKKQDESEL